MIKTKEDFLTLALEVHGNKYNYDKVEFINSSTKVCITCPVHGDFWQAPIKHVNNRGCPKCKLDNLSKKFRMSTEDFVAKAKKIHGDKYYYDKVSFKNLHQKILIVCPEHGEFEQEAQSHLVGCGCPKCSLINLSNRFRFSREEFIERANKIHNNKYDYSEVIYKNNSTKIKIICPEHGAFYQNPNSHLKGFGCVECGKREKSELEKSIKEFLSNNNILFEEQKSWDWLIFKNPQYADFYLPEYEVIIECQGRQHFEYVEHFKNDVELEESRDENKLKLCEEHGICVLYFSNLSTKNKKYQYPYTVYEDLGELLQAIKQIGLTNQSENKQN